MKKTICILLSISMLLLSACTSKYYKDADAAAKRFNASAEKANEAIEEFNTGLEKICSANAAFREEIEGCRKLLEEERLAALHRPAAR